MSLEVSVLVEYISALAIAGYIHIYNSISLLYETLTCKQMNLTGLSKLEYMMIIARIKVTLVRYIIETGASEPNNG